MLQELSFRQVEAPRVAMQGDTLLSTCQLLRILGPGPGSQVLRLAASTLWAPGRLKGRCWVMPHTGKAQPALLLRL